MASLNVLSEPVRQSRIAFVFIQLSIDGREHLLLNFHRKWGDWSLVGGHVEDSDLDFRSAACREAAEELAPLEPEKDFRIESLHLAMDEWGPVESISANGQQTIYRAEWFLLRFLRNPIDCLAKLSRDEFRLARSSDVLTNPNISSTTKRGMERLARRSLPLSWSSNLTQVPLDSVGPSRFKCAGL